MKRTASQQGYTLVEVLVALAIISIALTAVLQALQLSTRSTQSLKMRNLALHSASNTLAELRLQQQFPSPGTQNYPCTQGMYEFNCEVTSASTEHAKFRQITVRVTLPDHQQNFAYLHGILMQP
ncbi:type II secretion system protein GspI [Alcaligenaceae bacterium 429]|nr:type II secretion system protein GspI [Alcaligenaceae bacterium 429]